MKKICSIIVVGLICLLCACDDSRSRIRAGVDELNKACPVKVGLGNIVKASFDNDTVTYTFLIEEKNMKMSSLRKHPEVLKSSFAVKVKDVEDRSNDMLSLMEKKGISLKCVFIGNSSNEEAVCILSPKDLDEILYNLTSQRELDFNLLKCWVDILNEDMPDVIEQGMTAQRVELQDKAIVYRVELDENIFDFKAFKEAKGELKHLILEGLSSEYDYSTLQQIAFLISCNMTLNYSYYGSKTKDTLDVVLNLTDLIKTQRKLQEMSKMSN